MEHFSSNEDETFLSKKHETFCSNEHGTFLSNMHETFLTHSGWVFLQLRSCGQSLVTLYELSKTLFLRNGLGSSSIIWAWH